MSKNLTGQTFANLEVLRRDDDATSGGGKHIKWICRCKLCGNERSVRSSDLINGQTKDCGCTRTERNRASAVKDLSNKSFGHLQVIGRDLSIGHASGQHARWLCRCDLCGSIESVSGRMLTSYGKDRCAKCNGGMSIGESKIAELLKANEVDFRYNASIGCVNPKTGYPLQFDFVIDCCDGVDRYIVEFDGYQHFNIAPQSWERTMPLEQRIRYDEYKNKWCLDNGIPLIRIPYTYLNKLCFNDLLPSKTAFLV